MNSPNLVCSVLAVFSVMGLVKGLWGLLAPDSFKRFAGWWAGGLHHVNTLTAIACALLAVASWVIVLIGQPLASWLLILYGALFAAGALLYSTPQRAETIIRRCVTERSTLALRLLSATAVVFSALVLWAALRGA